MFGRGINRPCYAHLEDYANEFLEVFIKFYELFLDECAELDEKIAYKLAEDSSEVGNQ